MSKVAIVTGGTSGIGEATAKELAGRGWQVAAMARGKAHPEIFTVKGDVAQDADCRRAAKQVLDRWGRIDALVNNAGTTKMVPHPDLEGLSAEDFERIYRLNVIGPFQMVRACAAALKSAQGAVVNVSSVASVLGTGSSVAYAASKAALNAMTYSLARSLGPEVRVNAVCPGWVDTPWHANAYDAERVKRLSRHYASLVPLKDYARPEDVADSIVWLIEGARHVTGEAIFVDGGLHISPPR